MHFMKQQRIPLATYNTVDRMLRENKDEVWQQVIDTSYRNYHTTGFDYICLKRSPEYTAKLYILDGDASKLPEVVNPHDHRYYFRSTCLAGRMADYRFQKDHRGEVFNAFDYFTPLNGGPGFVWRGEERLLKSDARFLHRGDSLNTAATDLHTIQMAGNQTVILLEQYEDVVPLDLPTSCWSRAGEPKPDATGMYDRFTVDQLKARLKQVKPLLNRSRRSFM